MHNSWIVYVRWRRGVGHSTRTCLHVSERWRVTASISAARCRMCASRSRAAARCWGLRPASVRRSARPPPVPRAPLPRGIYSPASAAMCPLRPRRRPAQASDPRRLLTWPSLSLSQPLHIRRLRGNRNPRRRSSRWYARCVPRTTRCRRRCSSSRSTRRSSTNSIDSPCRLPHSRPRRVHRRAPPPTCTDCCWCRNRQRADELYSLFIIAMLHFRLSAFTICNLWQSLYCLW